MRTNPVPDRSVASFAGKLTLFFACCYFGEVMLGGPGSWSRDFLGVDVRKLLFGCVCLMLMTGVVRNGTLALIDVIVLTGGMGLFAFWMIVMPMIKGTDMSLSAADGVPIFSMFLITILFKIYSDHSDQERALLYEKMAGFVFFMSGVCAAVHLALFAALNVLPDMGFVLLVTLKLILDNQDAGSIFVGPMPDGSIRVFWISSLFLVYGLYRVVRNLGVERNVRNCSHLLLFCAAILVTQTRSIFLAVPVAFCFSAIFYVWIRFSRVSLISLSIGLAATLFAITFIQLALVSTDVMSLIGLAREGSDQERGLQVGPLLKGWMDNLIVGAGFGYSVSYVRSEAAPYSYEFSILALYVKLGLVGLVLAWTYFLYMGNSLARSLQPVKRLCFEYGSLVFLIFIYFFIFNTNPYLSNSVGVAIFLLICIEAARLFKTPSVLQATAEEGGR
jgi:hypothetical protein